MGNITFVRTSKELRVGCFLLRRNYSKSKHPDASDDAFEKKIKEKFTTKQTKHTKKKKNSRMVNGAVSSVFFFFFFYDCTSVLCHSQKQRSIYPKPFILIVYFDSLLLFYSPVFLVWCRSMNAASKRMCAFGTQA